MKVTKKLLNEFIDFTIDMAYEAGEILLRYQKKRQTLHIKDKGSEGIASIADKKSEELIIGTIKQNYPEHSILSEEDFSEKPDKSLSFALDSEFTWVIDPLDGTNNFVNGIPIFAISIALLNYGTPLMGVVYNPLSGECFFAGKEIGAFLVDFRINPLKRYALHNDKNIKQMHECIFSPAPVYEITQKFERQLSVFQKNIVGARAVRRLGSAALELCYVANGNFDAYWEKGLKPWDVAAALLICKEAGVVVTDFDGQDSTPFQESIIAACEPLHSRIIGRILV